MRSSAEPSDSDPGVPGPQQIFISYARDDDEPPPGQPDAQGFVTHLHNQLLYELKQLGQPRPRLWRDTKRIERGDQFEPELEQALAASSVLLVVLSRNWIARDWCRRELEVFARQFPHENERSLRERIVVVRKNAVDAAAHPKLLQGQEGYSLHSVDPENRRGDPFLRARQGGAEVGVALSRRAGAPGPLSVDPCASEGTRAGGWRRRQAEVPSTRRQPDEPCSSPSPPPT